MSEFPLDSPTHHEKPWPTACFYTVGEAERYQIAHVSSKMTIDSLQDPEGYVRQARLIASQLPVELLRTLFDFERFGDGALVIRSVEVGPIGRTPASPDNDVTHTALIAHTTALVVSAVAKLVAYRGESWGRFCQCIVPTRAAQQAQTSTGWGVCLECHTEQAFNLSTRPDYIALGCLRGDQDAITYVMSARTLQKQLPGWAEKLLWDKAFLTRVDRSFIDGGVRDEIRGPIAVLSGAADDPVITFDEDLMWSESSEHQEALSLVKRVWAQHRSEVVLQKGDILIIDNSRAIHGRSAFVAQFDGGDRWLCRFQGVCNVATIRHACRPGSSVIEISGC